MKKYSIHIAFSEKIGELILKEAEHIKKYSDTLSPFFNPLLCEFDGNKMLVKRPEKNGFIQNAIVLSLELYFQIPLRWMMSDSSTSYKGKSAIEDFFELQYAHNIIEDRDIDGEMHLMLYVPLYENGVVEHVTHIIDALPQNHKYIVNVIAIPYDIALSCNLTESIEKEYRQLLMLRNIKALTELRNNSDNILRQIFFCQNYSLRGWSEHFTMQKLVETYSELSMMLIEHFDEICHYRLSNKPIYAFNIENRYIDKFLIVNNWYRNILKDNVKDYRINPDEVDKDKVRNSYKKILDQETSLINEYKNKLSKTLGNQSELNDIFSKDVKEKLLQIVQKIITEDNLNYSEKQFLYSLFNQIDNNTDFESDDFDDSIWDFENLRVKELDDDSVTESYLNLKKCSKEIADLKSIIEEEEKRIQYLSTQINENYEYEGEYTEDGFVIGKNLFMTYSEREVPLSETYMKPEQQSMPSSIDLRKYFSSIKNQGQLGACTSFSMVSVIEYILRKYLKDNTDLSESFVYYNGRALSNETNLKKGMTFSNALKAVQENGVCVERLWPYREDNYSERPKDDAYTEAQKRRITEAKNVKVDIDDVKSAIAQGYPVVISLHVFKTFHQNKDGVVKLPLNPDFGEKDKYHAMVVCGYDDKTRYFYVRNSWDTDWGDEGYCYIPYSFFRDPNLIDQAYIVTGVNLEGVSGGDIPEGDSLLNGKGYDAQYDILKNMLSEEQRVQKENRKRLQKLQLKYVAIYNSICDSTNMELTLKDIKDKTDAERAKLEEELKNAKELYGKKTTFDKIKAFLSRNSQKQNPEILRIIRALDDLECNSDDLRRSIRLKNAIISGLTSINKELMEENGLLLSTSDLVTKYEDQINLFDETDGLRYNSFKQHTSLNLGEIFSKFVTHSGICSLFNQFKSDLSGIRKGINNIYDLFGDLQHNLMNFVNNEFDYQISDYVECKDYAIFFDHIKNSSVMAMIDGGLPQGYGDEVKYFFYNKKVLPNKINSKETKLLQTSDTLRMSFLHIEKYDIKDLEIFNGLGDIFVESARIASHVYGHKPDSFLRDLWKVSSRNFDIERNNSIVGLQSEIYESTKDEGKYIYAIAGTKELTNIPDWLTNIGQLFGMGAQHIYAVENAKKICDAVGKDNVIFVGHSLGGGVAALCAMVTDAKAITFNAAGISLPTKENYYISDLAYEGNIEAFIMDGDPLDKVQSLGLGDFMDDFKFMSPFLRRANGNIRKLYPFDEYSENNRHAIASIIRTIDIKG